MNCEKISSIFKKTCKIANSIIDLHIKHLKSYFIDLKKELKQLNEELKEEFKEEEMKQE